MVYLWHVCRQKKKTKEWLKRKILRERKREK